jgi:hypothetical protein
MGKLRTAKFRAVLAQVNRVLYEDWAPIGFVGALPRDEYESYAMRVVSLLAAQATEEQVAAYLASAAEAITGDAMAQTDVRQVARRLMEFGEASRSIGP